jgi:hypothetical protein
MISYAFYFAIFAVLGVFARTRHFKPKELESRRTTHRF